MKRRPKLCTWVKKLGIVTLDRIDSEFKNHFTRWMNEKKALKIDYSKTVQQCLDYLFNTVYPTMNKEGLEPQL